MKYIYTLLCVLLVITFSACGNQKTIAPHEYPTQSAFQNNDSENQQDEMTIDDVIDQLYENNTVVGVVEAKDEDMENVFGFDMSIIDEYYVRYSAKNYGLADVFVIKTDEEHQQDIFEALTNIKEDRVSQFENYIIYDSLDIAKKAEIYSKGDYVIMLMIKNQADAKEILDNFLTEKE